jgi:hypothetical protein
MLELINKIPDSVGWTMVGFTMCLCVVVAVKLAVELVKIYRYCKEEGNEND